jgi:hypothetical protein
MKKLLTLLVLVLSLTFTNAQNNACSNVLSLKAFEYNSHTKKYELIYNRPNSELKMCIDSTSLTIDDAYATRITFYKVEHNYESTKLRYNIQSGFDQSFNRVLVEFLIDRTDTSETVFVTITYVDKKQYIDYRIKPY